MIGLTGFLCLFLIASVLGPVQGDYQCGNPGPESEVSFDRARYVGGDWATITVTEPTMAGQPEIAGEDVLVLKDRHGGVVLSWDRIPVIADQLFQVEFKVPGDIATGTIRAVYTHPTQPDRTAEATAWVPKPFSPPRGIVISPKFLWDEVAFMLDDDVGLVADRFSIMIYDLTGRKVDEFSDTNTRTLTWDGGNLRSTAYIYVAVVESEGLTWTFSGPVYIWR